MDNEKAETTVKDEVVLDESDHRHKHEQEHEQQQETDGFKKRETWKEVFVFWLPIATMCFMMWLDEGILATAIPHVSDSFQSFDQIAWYGPSYLFGLCISQVPFGRAYRDLPTRVTYLFCLLLFEVASIVQAAAPSSEVFIFGRVLAGMAGSGVGVGSIVLCSEELPESKVVYVMSSFSWIHALGSVAGPIIGGTFSSSSLTWRWCFYINPIIAAVAIVPILLTWKGQIFGGAPKKANSGFVKTIREFDWIGMASFVTATALLLLALQFGGSMFTWSDAKTIGLLVAAVVIYLIHGFWEWRLGNSAMVPIHVLTNRVIVLGLAYMALLDATFFILTYGMPLWFQAVQNLSAQISGYRIIPMLVGCILSSTTVMTLTARFGYYQPLMLICSSMLTAGASILTTLNLRDSVAKWLTGGILTGVGTGASPLPLVALRHSIPKEDIPIGFGVVLTAGYLGATIGLAVAQAIFATLLERRLTDQFPSLDAHTLANSGATELRRLVPESDLPYLLQAYSDSLSQSWFLAVALAAISIFVVFGLGWRRLPTSRDKDKDKDKDREASQSS